jgi:uncharacterized membrane protein
VDIMLNKVAFASALALLTGALYLVLYVLAVLMPTVFRFIFNAQFLGADVASLLPRELSFLTFDATLVVLVITTWVFGYLWAWLYNRFAKLLPDLWR